MNPSAETSRPWTPWSGLARMADHIPDPGKHRTHFYAHYANRTRGSGADKTAAPDLGAEGTEAEKPKKRCSPSWARLLATAYRFEEATADPCESWMPVASL